MECYIYAIPKAIANKDCIVVLSCFILCLCYWDTPRCESGSIRVMASLFTLAKSKLIGNRADGLREMQR